MKYIQIDVLQWGKDLDIFLVLQRGIEPFEDAPTFIYEWKNLDTLTVLSPLFRPIPKGYNLYLAKRRESFPYNTTQIVLQKQLFNPTDHGTYFLASHEQVEILQKIIKS